MRKRLIGITVCLLLANVVNYALNQYLDRALPPLSESLDGPDGSTLLTSRYYEMLGIDQDSENATRRLLKFYAYLDEGGGQNYLGWQSDRSKAPYGSLVSTALERAASSNTVEYLSLLLLIVTTLLLYGRGLRPEGYSSPLLYFLIVSATTALFGGLQAPLFTGMVGLVLLLYFGGLLLFLPIYRTEWCRTMRPLLTPCLLLLAVMAWRGHELVDYWFWTSHLFRLALVFALLLAAFFHLTLLDKTLAAAKMPATARIFAFGFPLGVSLIGPGLLIGLFGADAGAGVGQLNEELVVLPREFVSRLNPDLPFTLLFAGAMILILSGIGYYIQRIAQ